MQHERPARVLVVDDDPELLQFLQDEFSQQGLDCSSANCGGDALLSLRQESLHHLMRRLYQQEQWLPLVKSQMRLQVVHKS